MSKRTRLGTVGWAFLPVEFESARGFATGKNAHPTEKIERKRGRFLTLGGGSGKQVVKGE